MNYLDLVNGVLRRLREEPVSSLYENKQSAVVAQFVNDAKRTCENKHNWSHLRRDVQFVTGEGITTYALPDTDNRATILDMRNMTSFSILRQVPSAYIRRQTLINNVGQTKPSYYAPDGVNSNGDVLVRLWPTPDSAYIMRAFCIVRTPDLEAEGDILTIPHQPVLMQAHALAAQERGDVSSQDVQSLFVMAQRSLGEHIMLDSGQNPDEMIWAPV